MSSSLHSSNTLMTEAFLQKAFPEPKDKNFHTQLGVHHEEIAEMLDALHPRNNQSQFLLEMVKNVNKDFSEALKTGVIHYDIKDRIKFLDGICDQLVTATGVGYMAGMNVSDAFGEVNESNNSKIGPNGPIYDENQKLMKGPDYFPPDLKSFV